jgi:hypothetical protein
MGMENVPRCQHVKVNGVQCGSPALRRKRFCYFHERVQYERKLAAQDKSAPHNFGFPLLEDVNSIQVALMKTVQMLGAGSLDRKTAGLMFYALQIASANVRHAKFEPEKLTDTIIDEDTVDLTRLGGPQWSSRDFAEAEREKPKDEINVPLPSAEHPAHSMVAHESAADVAGRRERKRKLPPYAEDDAPDSLAKILLDRIIPGWQEDEAAEADTNAETTNSGATGGEARSATAS